MLFSAVLEINIICVQVCAVFQSFGILANQRAFDASLPSSHLNQQVYRRNPNRYSLESRARVWFSISCSYPLHQYIKTGTQLNESNSITQPKRLKSCTKSRSSRSPDFETGPTCALNVPLLSQFGCLTLGWSYQSTLPCIYHKLLYVFHKGWVRRGVHTLWDSSLGRGVCQESAQYLFYFQNH